MRLGSVSVPTLGQIGNDVAWLTVAEVSEMLRLSLSTTCDLVRQGKIPSVKLRKRRRIRRSVLERFGQ